MQTEEIGPRRWQSFFEGFSRAHEGWLANVEVLGKLGAQPVASELPLVGIIVDGPARKRSVSIVLGRGDELMTHTISKPAHVEIERTDQGADAAVEIESKDGEKTLLTFRTTAPTEAVDGIPRT
jgi:hypothetical protein